MGGLGATRPWRAMFAVALTALALGAAADAAADARNTNLAPPRVHPINAVPHAVLGKDMELQCYATLMAPVNFSMKWFVPVNSTAKEEGRLNTTNATVHFDGEGLHIGSTILTLVSVTDKDAGAYTCFVEDHTEKNAYTTFLLEVRDANVSFIDVNIPFPDALHQRVGLLQTATWTLEVVTYPTSPTIAWFTPAGRWLREGSAAKFPLRKRERGKGVELTLSVLEVELSDRGTYALKINTGMEEKTVNLTLTVLAVPRVQLQAPPEPCPLGATRKITCTALGSPLPTVQWAWHPCPGLLRNCAPDDARYVKVWAPVTTQSDVEVISTLELLANSSGFVTCRAANELDDSVNETISLQVTDMPGPGTLEAWGPEPEPAVEGDDLRLWCVALRENHTEWPHWRRSELWDDKRFQMTRSNTTLSLRSQLRINPASVADSGSYLCSLDGLEETTVEYNLDVKPQRKVFPRDVNMNNTEWMVNTWDKLILRCNFDGLPRPTISWYKDSEPFAPPGGEQFRLQDGNQTLVIGFVTEADQGEYRCRAANRLHSEERWVRVQLRRSTNLAPPRVFPMKAVLHAVVGNKMELHCFATLMAHVAISMEWLVPDNSTAKEEGRMKAPTTTMRFNDKGKGVGSTKLKIVNVTENDAGAYTCLVKDHSKKTANTTILLEVWGSNLPFIDVNTPSADALHQRVGLLQTATWTLEVVTYPTSPTFFWYTPAGRGLREGSSNKFRMLKRERGKGLELTLSVVEVELSDRGTYVVEIYTWKEVKRVNLTLTVLAVPRVQLQVPPEPWPLGATRKVTCTALGSPLPTVQWAWHPCPGLLRNCAPDDARYVKVWAPVTTQSDVEVISTLELLANSSGFVTCRAANELDDSVNETIGLQVTDLPGPRTLEAWGPEPEPAVEGDDLRLWCGALRENHTEWPHWRRSELWDDKRFQMTRSDTTLSLRSQLRINPASVADSGSYLCFLDDLEETTVEYKLDVKPQRNVFPRDVNMNNTEWMANTRDKLVLRCNFDGLPRPTISWYKDSEPFAPPSGEQFRLQDGNKTLVIGFVTEADQGEYRCRAANRVHSEERWVRVQLHNRKGITAGMVALIVVLVVLLLTVVPLSLFVYKDWKRRRMLISGLHHFAEGQPDVLNPELPADEQAELLPYDRKWEFPRERLKLGCNSVNVQYTTPSVRVP